MKRQVRDLFVIVVMAVVVAACGRSEGGASAADVNATADKALGSSAEPSEGNAPAVSTADVAGRAARSGAGGAGAAGRTADSQMAGPAAAGSSASAAADGGTGGTGAGDTPTAAGAAAISSKAGAAGAAAGSGAAGAAGSSDPVDAAALAKAMRFGANIGNTLENTTTWETGWGQPMISQAFIDGMASHGIKSVRVPVAWDTYATNGTIDPAKLARVKEVVSWIEAAGMYAIVNIHWDGGWIFNENKPDAYKLTDTVKTKFASYWQQIATGFSDVGHSLILEGLNEEGRFYINGDSNGMPDIPALNEINQLFVTTVRTQAGYNTTRALLIAGFNTDIAKTCVDAFAVPEDPAGTGKLLLSIHYYDPYPFTLMEDPASWGSPKDTWGSDDEKKALEDSFDKLGSFTMAKKIPVILGEFAVIKGMKTVRQPASRVLWMESVAKAAMSRGMAPVLWDTGTEISRMDGSLSTELQTVISDLK